MNVRARWGWEGSVRFKEFVSKLVMGSMCSRDPSIFLIEDCNDGQIQELSDDFYNIALTSKDLYGND